MFEMTNGIYLADRRFATRAVRRKEVFDGFSSGL